MDHPRWRPPASLKARCGTCWGEELPTLSKSEREGHPGLLSEVMAVPPAVQLIIFA
jgi:hypothetical protein